MPSKVRHWGITSTSFQCTKVNQGVGKFLVYSPKVCNTHCPTVQTLALEKP